MVVSVAGEGSLVILSAVGGRRPARNPAGVTGCADAGECRCPSESLR
jgi:hypothetical protein